MVLTIDRHSHRSDCFVEIEQEGYRIVQAGDLQSPVHGLRFRSLGNPVRPVAHLSLSDYELDPRLIKRLSDRYRGVFVVREPGSGKTTFAQAIAAYLDEEIGAMVKTLQAPETSKSLNV